MRTASGADNPKPDRRTRILEIRKLVRAAGSDAVPWLSDLYENEEHWRIPLEAVRALGAFSTTLAITTLEFAAVDKSAWVRHEALRSLAKIDGQEGQRIIEWASEVDPAPAVRKFAGKLLQRMQRNAVGPGG